MAAQFFTSRFGGQSEAPFAQNNLALHVGDRRQAVLANRRLLQDEFGPVCFMNQSHSNLVCVVEGIVEQEPQCDALVTQSPGIYLAVLTADCVPLLMWDDESTCVAAVHVGRRGLQNGIALRTVAVMRALGAGNIFATLGPSICGPCYEVGSDIYQEVVSIFPKATAVTAQGTLALDLPAALIGQLDSVNIQSARSRECTVENETYYSYRRDGITGRAAGLIRL